MDPEVEQLHLRADSLVAKFEQEGKTSYIDEAIILDRQALDLRPSGHPDRSMSLNNVAAHLFMRYNQLGALADIDEAVVLDRQALELRPREHPDRSMSLNNLAAHLSTRFNQLGTMTDLDEAISFNREALDLCPRGHPDRSIYLNNLSIHLSTRYRLLGAITDLEEAIVLSREALDLRPPGYPNRAMALSNLAVDLSTRYQQLGEITDLEEAILLGRDALELCQPPHPSRSRALNNLAGPLSTRFTHLGQLTDLDEAITLGREALTLRPRGHPDRPISLNNVAGFLSARFHQVGDLTNLDEALALDREALDLRPRGHPDRAMSLNALADLLSARHKGLDTITDLNEAIKLSREALELCARGHPDWSMSLNSLAYRLRTRFAKSSEAEDQEELFTLYAQLEQIPQMVSSEDLSAAKAWVDAAEHFHHPTLLPAYKTSLRLLIQHLTALPSLPQHPIDLKKLSSSLAADALSACLRNNASTDAVELLELGRGAFWNQLIHLRSPFDDVVVFSLAGKTLTDEFKRLSSLIHNARASPASDPAQYQQARDLDSQLERVAINIRQLPGLSRFLLPPLFSDLQLAADGGPVIIMNASTHSCDALVVLPEQDPVRIPLPITKERVRELSSELHSLTSNAKRVDVTRNLASILREVWDQAVSPIVSFLQKTHPPQSRIWWCPTADFSFLPLHAAGPYREGQPNLDDIYVSSYTPTLAALIRARRRSPLYSTMERKHVVAIGHTSPKGENELISVGTELSSVARYLEDRTIFTRLEGPECCISQVTEDLGKNQWVHLACHGLPNPKQPIESSFTLHDGQLTVQQIAQCGLQNPEFAYLSARHTSLGDSEILEEVDEMVHPAFSLQLSGFRSVIGTMGAVDDGYANQIASAFYENVLDGSDSLDHSRAALALHKTLKSLESVPLDQRICYLHVGV